MELSVTRECAGKENTYHLYELAVLSHHGMNNPQERFVAREQPSPSGKSVSLEHALTCML